MLHKKINFQAGILAAYQKASSDVLFSLWLVAVRDFPSKGTVMILLYIAGRF